VGCPSNNVFHAVACVELHTHVQHFLGQVCGSQKICRASVGNSQLMEMTRFCVTMFFSFFPVQPFSTLSDEFHYPNVPRSVFCGECS
jgi:hypothetical protein